MKMIKLYSWQEKALEAWKRNNYRGILSVVTGAGKTFVAIKAIELLLKEDNNLKTVIIVPTIALLNQWKEMIQQTMKIDESLIGLSGSKFSDELKEKKIMIYVANSALKFLKKQIKEDKSNPTLFLIADECHRYGSIQFSSILKNNYKYTLGLSATPERESDYGFEDYLEPYIGRVIFKYNYAEATKDRVISRFEVINYGISLSDKEKEEYRKLSERIKDLRTMLEGRYPIILAKKGRYIAELRKHDRKDPDIKKFLDLSVDRKRMLYRSESRVDCILQLVMENKLHKIMIFHEDVNSLNTLYNKLIEKGYKCAIMHYQKKMGDIEDFKENDVRIFLSVRMFSEGVDLPDVDLGIIAAASSSVRQKIQTMGRIIRKSKTKDIARIINIFIKDTTDERVFSKIDWGLLLGTNIMKSYTWPDKKEFKLRFTEKKRFRSEAQEDIRIKEKELKPKEIYTAQLTGQRFSFDSNWKLFRRSLGRREYAKNQEDLSKLVEMVRPLKPEAGSFFINDNGHVIIKNKEFDLIFAGTFDINKICF